MERNKVNYLVNLGLLVTFTLVFVTGIIKMPLWTQVFSSVYLILGGSTINLIHDSAGFVMGLLVLVHLALHWKWIVEMTKELLRRGR